MPTQKGFASIILLLVLVVLIGVGSVIYINPMALSDEGVEGQLSSFDFAKEKLGEVDRMKNGFEVIFEITTHGTKRNFNNTKYFNQNEVVYIDSLSPNKVHVKASNITWGQFFDTLPFTLTSECLVTGIGEEFCRDDNELIFSINGVEDSNALDKPIKEGDKFRLEVK